MWMVKALLGNDSVNSRSEERYWQVYVHPDKQKTAFLNGQRLWQITVMPIGFCNAPATFERSFMETVLQDLTYDSCLEYLEEIIVTGRTFQEHLLNLQKMFHRF
jgi:hypothetical protein